jgi:type IX secretion system PorP/SprF family membrane protein
MKKIVALFKHWGLLFIGLIALSQNLYAQQDPQYTQYMFNMQAVNPAYVGSEEGTLSATLLLRRQWFGIQGAPITQTFSVNGSLLNGALGLGAVVLNDNIGATNATSALFNWAYHLRVTAKGKLGFGMYGGIRQFRTDYSNVQTSINNSVYDPAFRGISKGIPVVGVGLMYHTDKFYAGIATPQLVTTRYSVDKTIVQHNSHFFFNTGYVYELNPNIKLRPSFMLKYVKGSPLSPDINMNVWFKDKFGVGASYRVRDSFDLLFEFMANKNLTLGYAFDFTLTRLGSTTNPRGASHEIMIRYQGRTGKGGKDKIVTPRHF